MGSDSLYNMQLEGAASMPGGAADPFSINAVMMAMPKNSGIQILYPDLLNSYLLAKTLRPPLRELVMQMALNDIYGAKAISSEGGFMVREMNTNRQGSISMGINSGQPQNWADEVVYGKDYVKNNPKDKGNPLQI